MAEQKNSEKNSEKNKENNIESASGDSCCGACSSEASEADLLAEIDKLKRDYLYLRAEFDNHRKHTIKERSELLKYGSEKIIVDLLGVIDNFDRALEIKINSDNLGTYVKGVEMTAQELKTLLQKFGVSEVPAINMEFNPSLFEALGAEETTAVPAGHVLKVFKKPYKLFDKLIRPGQVIVARTPSAG